MLPKAYVAFSTLVADPQFAVVGVVLLAVVAEVGALVGFSKADVEENEVKTPVKDRRATKATQTAEILVNDEDVDTGIPVDPATIESRRIESGQAQMNEKAHDGHETAHASVSTKDKSARPTSPLLRETAAPKRKKRKKENAIDSLFAGLD